MPALALYTYFRSSCSYRVRIALALKGLAFDSRYIHLLRDGGENWQPEYRRQNPQGLVPTLVDGQRIFTQSLAIIEYLDECYPDPPLLPADVRDRARVRALAQVIASDIQPLNNLRVLDFLNRELGASEQQVQVWYRHWITEGFHAVEALLGRQRQTATCCCGDVPTVADICLIPQAYNALRFHCELEAFPTVWKVYEHCTTLPAFQAAAPENQADAA
ncbi:MAG: maleylacetoacetate isomerase [Pseudomonadota bacterium]|nr:maleylacetoacetate isomerase [Pseudomonadota bacterium]